ncbi:MAG: molybdenum cofactor guanylyltransferase [Deltaproteobacteria bacterium]|nr:molybdenum cofactor guanylyltransferase [Deltaproteobacteria bacterium]MBW2219999.1 molybdenum cofactor guanylyltransferase [Deltaproteobacteria bacterium]
MEHQCTGVILAGGLNTRFSGAKKAFEKIGGKTILSYTYDLFRELFDEIILITNDPIDYLAFDVKIATDIYPVRSSLTGIHTGLAIASNRYAFISACDTPFIKKELVELVLDGIDEKTDIVLPETEKGIEPLCAVYSKQCLTSMAQSLKKEKLKIKLAIRNFRIKNIPEDLLRKKDPELVSFFNINTPEDIEVAENMIKKGQT